jgi:ligand-binding SRPBCC domain-containing protein
MKLKIQTSVEKNYLQVWEEFTEDLFNQLSPPFPPVKVIQFDGCHKGDTVELELNFLLFKQRWRSLITDLQSTNTEIFFLDEGVKLPFFLTFWKHRHRIIKNGDSTIIADEIEFKTPTLLTNYLFYPLLWLQFAYRKPIYQKVFRKQ